VAGDVARRRHRVDGEPHGLLPAERARLVDGDVTFFERADSPRTVRPLARSRPLEVVANEPAGAIRRGCVSIRVVVRVAAPWSCFRARIGGTWTTSGAAILVASSVPHFSSSRRVGGAAGAISLRAAAAVRACFDARRSAAVLPSGPVFRRLDAGTTDSAERHE
jgi:hypothetical protein